MINYFSIIIAFIFFTGGLFAAYFGFKSKKNSILEEAKSKAEKILKSSEKEVKKLLDKYSETAKQYTKRIEELEKKQLFRKEKLANAIALMEEKLSLEKRKIDSLVEAVGIERALAKNTLAENEQIQKMFIPKLSEVSGVLEDEVKKDILEKLNEELSLMNELRMIKKLEHINEKAEEKSKEIMVLALQRYSSESSVDKNVPFIPIRKNETKKMLIGNNSENIILLEDLTGVNIIFDDDKKGVLITHYQLVKREIAKETVMKLLKEKRINSDLIKIKFSEAQRDMKKLLIKIGGETLNRFKFKEKKFDDDFKELVGRMKYRTSYGQNILSHSMEVGYFAMIIGSELDLNVETCLLGGFLGDIGKAIDQDEERPHDILTKEIMEKFNFSWEEVHASWTHHDSIPIETPEALVVKGADALSAGRPGCRQETLEKYQERVAAIVAISSSRKGVKKSYAISGGRELRVFVDPNKLKDDMIKNLADDIAGEIEGTVAYPGEIKVRVIRRTQHKKIINEKAVA